MAIETRLMTVEQYLAFDEASEMQHEYIDGELIPMPGGSGNHNMIVASVTAAFVVAIGDRDCYVFGSQMRIQIDDMRYVYPDVSAVCGDPVYGDQSEVTLLNPTVVVEVTSPSSQTKDHVDKVAYYSAVPSIEGYLILDQERVFAEWHRRVESGWHRQQFDNLDDEIALEPLGCTLTLSQVYRGVSL
ncbi:MAG: Uma2 family endonuclease [Chloroflexi bacterium]|nr:Uma2 family endonuclease [Chloroflexota bacterium]